jgi:hypothetical protein
LTETRDPTEEEWKQASLRLEDGFHAVIMKELTALAEAGFNPYNFRFCGLGAHLMSMGRLIGANSDPDDRMLMFEYIGGDGMDLLRTVADGVAQRAEEISERPN